jgi:glutamate--cysteine ligase
VIQIASISADLRTDSAVLTDIDQAAGYIVSICFKTGPPKLTGVELEWTVHDDSHPALPIEAERLRAALGPHAPTSLSPDSPQLPLARGSIVTVEPGGQVEISTLPSSSLARLAADTAADSAELTQLLAAQGLVTGDSGIDPHRPPLLLLDTPRYRAMQRSFERSSPYGLAMMCSTASVQVSIDAGTPDRVASRWSAAHAIGPVLLAAFANSGRHAERDTGWASGRMRTWLGIDPARSGPVYGGRGTDVAHDWARYALAAPLLCRRSETKDWSVSGGVSFADWIRKGEPDRPTLADLDYHLSTLFPFVRPRGYLELRYLDAQPAGQWLVPAAILAGLNTDDALFDESRQVCEPVRHRWWEAARLGLADPPLAAAAAALVDVACRAVAGTDLPPQQVAAVTETIERRLRPGAAS